MIANPPRYTLPDDFLAPYKTERPNMSIPAYVTYMRTYAAKVGDRLEYWWETCKRVVEGAFSILEWHATTNQIKDLNRPWLDKWAKTMFDRMFRMKWVPAGRGLQHMGRESMWKKGGAVLNSCAFISTKHLEDDLSAPFAFLMDMSMLGVGVGFDTLGAGSARVVAPSTLKHRVHYVEDTREGWVNVLRTVLKAFEGDGYLPAVFDFSGVRKAGEPLGTMGGVASGPGPLVQLVWDLFEVLALPEWKYKLKDDGDLLYISCLSDVQEAEERPSYPITSEQISDIANIAGKCVVSGGIRRSAEIGLGTPDDRRFRDIKRLRVGLSDDWQNATKARFGWAPETRNDAWRWAANNSFLLDERMDRRLAREIAESVAEYGDPGILNRWLCRTRGRLADGVDHSDFLVEGTNPCGEQQLEDGELCNLVEISAPAHESAEDFVQSCVCAFIYGKIVSLLPTHRRDVNHIIQRNRRVGVSQTGYFRALEKFGREEMIERCNRGYAAIQKVDSILSKMFAVPESIRTTSIKPSGTVSLVLDVPSGLRPDEAPYYIRRIRFEKTSDLVTYLRDHGYPVEQDKQSPNSVVVSFPVATGCSRGVADVSAREQLEMVVDLQTYWSDNMVSNTIQFLQSEKNELAGLIYEYGDRIKSLSFLCYDGHKYEQAPFEAITKDEYQALVDNIIPLDYALLGAYSTHDQEDKFCEGIACTIGGRSEEQ